METASTAGHSRPGTEHLRQAIVALPLGLVVLVIGAAVSDSNEGIGMPLVLVGVLAAAFGLFRLLQGLWRRVA